MLVCPVVVKCFNRNVTCPEGKDPAWILYTHTLIPSEIKKKEPFS